MRDDVHTHNIHNRYIYDTYQRARAHTHTHPPTVLSSDTDII